MRRRFRSAHGRADLPIAPAELARELLTMILRVLVAGKRVEDTALCLAVTSHARDQLWRGVGEGVPMPCASDAVAAAIRGRTLSARSRTTGWYWSTNGSCDPAGVAESALGCRGRAISFSGTGGDMTSVASQQDFQPAVLEAIDAGREEIAEP